MKKIIAFIFIIVFLTSCNAQGVKNVYDITFEGGSVKAYVKSPVTVTDRDGKLFATLVWSSPNYDYVIVDGQKYENENPGGSSTFTVPVRSLDEPLELIGDTVAMSKPHEIEYRIIWNTSAGDRKDTDEDPEEDPDPPKGAFGKRPDKGIAITVDGMEPDGKLDLKYAQGFDITRFGPYRLISIYGVGNYLVVPEGEKVPNVGDTDEVDITILKQPLAKTYLVSTSAMDLVRETGSLGQVRFSPLKAEDWHIPDVRTAMDEGRMLYAGKYRMPDYEMLVSGGCDLAVENTMIYHSPDVIDKLNELGIPVMVETSSYESDPLGRLEWIKLYGCLFGNEKAADDFFEAAASRITAVSQNEPTGRKVACFYVSATGIVSVRMSTDYLARMIVLAGGDYVPSTGEETKGASSMNMQMEDFYATTKDADILIYNGTIDDSVSRLDDLLAKSDLFKNYRAVREKNVYCLLCDFFQNPTGMAALIDELADMLEDNDGGTDAGGDPDRQAGYLYRLE